MIDGRLQVGVMDGGESRLVFEAGDVRVPIVIRARCKVTGRDVVLGMTLQEATCARDVLQETIEALVDTHRQPIAQAPQPRLRHTAGGGR